MDHDTRTELYQQVILEHNKKPRNFKKLENATHSAEGYNPLCGDHLMVYLHVNNAQTIEDISFEGDGCAISKASASMMTSTLKGMKIEDAQKLFEQFHRLVTGELDPGQEENTLGKLAVFSGIWHFPARVKCAILSWHTMKGALEHQQTVSTE
ncbi:MAG TPA: SUF system NifU family Fe-S cluster assembly protein [Candidatus Omnitrophica bacterium]|nr:MAG: SUF system NifU family Fe-S cluster assembly protein [Omnitrophica WOR_2 bacterium GWA2_45_18]OGX19294.1 MAG: SUF system NifU family Fe-S cluster assembly protein [Omnitrophica WOR_2 bacterium GWC2_45_7]HBR15879.1 SUF system NifU family Fe-S cluster assembly protein [Candidatus Omnitrophota bacterium]